jgi:hypothetical protein
LRRASGPARQRSPMSANKCKKRSHFHHQKAVVFL